MDNEHPSQNEHTIENHDLIDLVEQAKTNNPDSTVRLFNYFQARFTTFYSSRLPEVASDLTMDAVADVLGNINDFEFEPNDEQDARVNKLLGWSFVIARSHLYRGLREHLQVKGIAFPLEGPSPTDWPLGPEHVHRDTYDLEEQSFEVLVSRLDGWLQSLLNPLQYRTVRLALDLEDNSDEVLAPLIGMKPAGIKNVLSRAREKIEDEILYPAGFKRVSSYNNGSYSTAVSRGSADAVRFLRMWYTRDEWFKTYLARVARSGDLELVNQGYVEVATIATHGEYSTLRGSRYKGIVVRSGNRYYIRPEALEEFRQRTNKRSPKQIDIPLGHVRFADLGLSQAQQLALTRAAQTGTIDAIKVQGAWVGSSTIIDQFLTSNKTKPLKTLQAIEQAPTNQLSIVYERAEELVNAEEGFKKWFLTIAKRASDRLLPMRKRQKNMDASFEGDIELVLYEDLLVWMTAAGIKSTDEQRSILFMKIREKKLDEIGKKLSFSPGIIRKHFNPLVKKITTQLLEPSGIKSLYTYGNRVYLSEAISGRFRAIRFLGHWYSTDEWVKEYETRNKQYKPATG